MKRIGFILGESRSFMHNGKKDGSVDCDVRVSPALYVLVNTGFKGKWVNAANIGKSEAEIIELRNKAHPDDPVET